MPAAHPAARATRPRWEVADVFRIHARDDGATPAAHARIVRDLVRCRTAALGGHVERCGDCGFERIAYNSCRNRHCPKCQAMAKAEWLEARRRELLPVGYFHVVFTMPHELNALALCNKRTVYGLLFRAAAETLQTFAKDPTHGLGGTLGFTAILHTWDQRLCHHAHIHCLVPGGALSPDGSRWIAAREGFLFPVKAMGRLFRGKFLAFIKAAHAAGKLHVPAGASIRSLCGPLYRKPWVVYAKPPFGGPQLVLDYLGRYTHRVAIANHRLLDVAEGKVSFAFRDRADGDRRKVCTLDAPEFRRRFLLHVLPKGFVRIRHFGFLAARSKGRDLPRCRRALGVDPPPEATPETTPRERVRELTGLDLDLCPCCGQRAMAVVRELAPQRHQPAPVHGRAGAWDTS